MFRGEMVVPAMVDQDERADSCPNPDPDLCTCLDEHSMVKPTHWTVSTRRCPACGGECEEAGWWDDPIGSGGACIGTRWRCADPTCPWEGDEA